MVTWRYCALFLAIVLPAEAGAQYGPTVPRRRNLVGDLLERGERTLAPSLALVGGEAELGFDGLLSWGGATDRPGALVRLGAFGRRDTRNSWGGAAAGLGYRFVKGAAQFWVAADGTAGAGTGPLAALVVRAGGRLGPVGLELRSAWSHATLIASRDSLGHRTTNVVNGEYRETEAEVHASRRQGRLSLAAVAGLRFGKVGTQREWGWLTLATALRGDVDVFSSLGSRSEQTDRGGHAGRFVQLGLRFNSRRPIPASAPPVPPPWPAPRFEAARSQGEAWILTLQISSASSVELTGDLTEWTPVSLVRSPGKSSVWRTTVHATPGMYHIALRIDHGPWWVPPGLVAIPDGYNGLAGLLELR
jgi:hypothetical protein